jgi:hypothetical protein
LFEHLIAFAVPFVALFLLAALLVLIAFVMDRLNRSGFLYYLEALPWGDGSGDAGPSLIDAVRDFGGDRGDA